MNNVEGLTEETLRDLLDEFLARGLAAGDLENGYIGASIPTIRQKLCQNGGSVVDFELALKELEEAKLVDTGPREMYDNEPGSSVFVIGFYSKREHVFLTTKGYKAAQKLRATKAPRAAPVQVNISGGNFQHSPIGVGSTVVQSMTVEASGETVFGDLRKVVSTSGISEGDRAKLLSAIEAMVDAKGTPSFLERYREFISQAADYMTLIGPYVPALTGLLASTR